MKPFKIFFSGFLVGILILANVNLYFLKPKEDVSDKLGDIVDTLKSDYYKEFDEDAFMEYMYESGVAFFSDEDTFNDPYTVYFPSDDYNSYKQALSDKYVGIGLTVKELVVQDTYADSPAQKAGFITGDILKTLDDVTLVDDEDFVLKIRAYETEQSFKIGFERDGKSMSYTLKKEEVKIENIHVDPEQEETANIPESIGYISMDQFSQSSFRDLKEQLEGIYKDKKGIILDLRGNPGGYLSEAEKIGTYLLPEGDTIYFEENREDLREVKAAGEGFNKPIVVIIDGYSASASELLAAALKENKMATVVGTNSYGKGVMQSTVQFDDGSGLKYTSAVWLTPNKNNINGIGVAPDYTEEDHFKQLEKAISVLEEKIDE